MPRCMISPAPEERSASRYLARRRSASTSAPTSRRRKFFGGGRRRSSRCPVTARNAARSIAGARPRRTVSTSGSSGTFTPSSDFRRCDSAVPAPPLWSKTMEPAMAENPAQRQADFGFRRVPLADKQGLVDDLFRRVARRYDLMNDLMSGGLHRAWKGALVTAIAPPRQARPFALLDVAGGTGDVAFRVVEAGASGTPVP